MYNQNHYICRVGDCLTFNKNETSLLKIKKETKTILSNMKTGDILWFLTNTSVDNKFIRMAEYQRHDLNNLDLQIYYDNLYNTEKQNINTSVKSKNIIINYENIKNNIIVNCENNRTVDLYEHYRCYKLYSEPIDFLSTNITVDNITVDNITVDNITVDNRTETNTINNNETIILTKEELIIRKTLMLQQNKILNNKIKKKNFKKSKILECKINNSNVKEEKYIQILRKIYNMLANKQFILEHTCIKTTEEIRNDKGFRYDNDIKLSIRGHDAKNTLIEIVNMIALSNITIEIKIILKSNEEIFIRIQNGLIFITDQFL